jgi:hypothetical protein
MAAHVLARAAHRRIHRRIHFDAAGKITGKYTYAGYDRPRLSRALGVPL